jgi:hypothetical protein
MRAQSPAITAADDLHGENQEHLFCKDVAQKHSFALKKSNFGIFVLQSNRFFLGQFFRGTVEKIEIPRYIFRNFIQAPRANQFNPRLQCAFDADLAVQQFRNRAHYQRLDEFEFRRVEIDCIGSVALVDANLVYREFVDIQKHIVCNHRTVPTRSGGKSRKLKKPLKIPRNE